VAKAATATATKLIPLHDRIVIKPIVQEEVLASGIVIPDTAKEKPQQGEVIAVGPGRLDDNGKRIPMDVKVGDRILYAKYSGQEVKIDGEEYIVLSEKDVLCKLER
jgi:chaperonin GroES